MTKVLVLELNEVNFDFVRAYIEQGKLPNFARLLQAHGYCETTSEQNYSDWEPWIQWVSAHSGKSLAEHKVYRLGDITKVEIDQIWEQLEREGLSVGAFSPMNANNRLVSPAFFLPDPWTDTPMSAPPAVRWVYGAIAKAVDENASGKVPPSAVLAILWGLLRFARPANYARYLSIGWGALHRRWLRPVFLDLFLGDLFLWLLKAHKPDFASVFLNGAAHLQHHYLFNSLVYAGPCENPDWYAPSQEDPILAIYDVYDRLVGRLVQEFPNARMMVATGLHQVPHHEETFYWRLKDHGAFLRAAGLEFVDVQALMSRDFRVLCGSAESALRNQAKLDSMRAEDGTPLFSVDNQGADLFVELAYAKDIAPGKAWFAGNHRFEDLRAHVDFVAIKNGEHDGMGYFVDTGGPPASPARFPIAELPSKIRQACGLDVAA